jgi:DNA-binding MarR family transcriptional regulator
MMTAWARIALSYRLVLDEVGQALKRAGLPPLGWYDVLLELDRTGTDGLRAVALERGLLLAQHNVSRLLARLEKEGLVSREPCEDDGRGAIIRITAEGLRLRKRMWPVYRDAVRRRMGAKLRDHEIADLGRLLGRIIG